jgi:hypothetical protein
LARAYYFLTTKLNSEDKEHRKHLFGQWRDGFQPIHPYRWQMDGFGRDLLEIPVTTMPFLKLPFHISYILYIFQFSPVLARAYFRMAIILCRLTQTQPSLLLHPLDFLGRDDISELAFFPAMRLHGEEKMKLVSDILSIYSEYYTIVSMREHVDALSQDKGINMVRVDSRSLASSSKMTR